MHRASPVSKKRLAVMETGHSVINSCGACPQGRGETTLPAQRKVLVHLEREKIPLPWTSMDQWIGKILNRGYFLLANK